MILSSAAHSTTIQDGTERSFLYHHVESYGKVKNALQHKALIDQAIFQQLPKLERKNTGFAAQFHEVCSERVQEFEQHDIANISKLPVPYHQKRRSTKCH